MGMNNISHLYVKFYFLNKKAAIIQLVKEV